MLANLLAYRYENNISILDDCEHEITGDYIKDIYYTIDQKYSDERVAEILKYEREHPEEMAKRLENSKELSRLIMTKMKPFIEEHPMEYWLNYGLNSSVNFKKHQ